MKKLSAVCLCALLAVSVVGQSNASSLSQKDIQFALSNKLDGQSGALRSVVPLDEVEMQNTKGAVAPLIGIVAFHGGRWVVTRYVSRRAAIAAAKRGKNIYTSRARDARSIAKSAYGRKNVIRHGPNGHKRSKVHHSHYQPKSRRGRGHVFYGRRYR